MIVHPFGFLASVGAAVGFTKTYKNLIRALGPQEYWGGEDASAIYRDELWQWSALGGAITHNSTGSPINTSKGYLHRPSAAGTQFHRYNASGVMGPAFVHSLWTRFPDPNDSSGKSQMFFQQGGSDLTELIYHSGSNFASWRALRGGVNKYLSYASYISTNTWHYISYQWKNDGTLWLTVDGILRVTDAHAGGASTTATLLWIQNTPDWNVDYDAVAVWKGPVLTGETSLINMNRPYWIVQNYVGYDCDAFSLSPTYFFRLDSLAGVETDPINSATLTFSGSPNRGQTSIIPDTESLCIDWVPSARAVVAGLTGWTSSDGFTASLFTICDSTAETWAYELAAQAPSPAMVMNFGGVSGDITVGLYDGGPTNRSLTFSGVDWGTTSMHHVVHAGTQNVDHKIYVDGVEVVNGVLTAVAGWGQSGTNNHLADNDSGAGNNYDGRMQDFKLYKRELTALEVALDNATARSFDSYEFEIAKRTPAMHFRCVDADEYPTNKFASVIGPNYGTRSGNVLVNRTGPQFVQDAGHLAADFDGANDFIGLTSSVDLDSKINGTGNFSISAWVYFDSFGVSNNTGRVVVSNANSYNFFQYNDTATLTGMQLELVGITLLTSDRPQYPLASMSTGQWYYFVGTYDSTAGQAKLYVDGVLQSTKGGLSGTLANPSGTQTQIGEYVGGFYDMDGAICHVTIDPESTWTLQQVRYSYYLGLGNSKADAYALSLSPDAYWPLDETAGTTATDVVNAYNGTYTSTYTLNSPTPLVNSSDPSVNFGNPGYVIGTHDFGNNGGTQFTVAGWVLPDNNGSNQYFMSKNSGIVGWAAFRVYRASNNLLRLYLEDGVRNPFWEIPLPGVFGGLSGGYPTWYHFCFVWDRVGATGASTDVTAYINGYKIPSLNYTSNGYTGIAFTFTEGNTEWRIMSLSANTGTQAEGTGDIAKVFIKNGTLTDAEVRQLYLSGLELDLAR